MCVYARMFPRPFALQALVLAPSLCEAVVLEVIGRAMACATAPPLARQGPSTEVLAWYARQGASTEGLAWTASAGKNLLNSLFPCPGNLGLQVESLADRLQARPWQNTQPSLGGLPEPGANSASL